VYCTSRRCLLIIGIIGLLYSPLPAEGRRVGVLYEQAVCINNRNYWSLLLERVGLFCFPEEGRHVGVLYEQAVCINNWNYSHLKGGGGLAFHLKVKGGGGLTLVFGLFYLEE